MVDGIGNQYAEALALFQAGYLKEAEAKYQQILALDSQFADAWRELGRVYLSQQREEEALVALERSLELDNSRAIQYYSLGLGLEARGYLNEAISVYETAIALSPNWIEVYIRLGDVWAEIGEFQQAEWYYQQTIELNSTEIKGYLGLGNLFLIQNQIEQAIATYQTALQFYPEHPDLFLQLSLAFRANQNLAQGNLYAGFAAYYQGEYEEAIDYFIQELQETGVLKDTARYRTLGDCYEQVNQLNSAIHLYQQGIQQYPESAELYIALIQALQHSGRTLEGLQVAERGLEVLPNDIQLKFAKQRLLPILYESSAEVEFYRCKFTQDLIEISQSLCLDTPEGKEKALKAISEETTFYLQYQGYNDLELQQQYGQFVNRVMSANYPEFCQGLDILPVSSSDQIKIGYVSSYLKWHTVGILFLGWLKHQNCNRFKTFCYHTGYETDEVTNLFNIYSDHFEHLPNPLEIIAHKIKSDQLHYLVFLDIGMSPLTTQLAGLRLAPIQCAAWGHPTTTGLPTIDYYISAQLLEPENAINHYSEKLVLLPNLGINYAQPMIPELKRTRADFGITEESIIYLSCQSLFKYLPQYDYIFAAIAQHVKQSKFIFIAHHNSEITQQFKKRLNRAFQQFGLDSNNFCLILPRLDKWDYLQLNLLADIGLDTLKFTGFLTSLDSLGCNLPIVTLEGELMRSRQTAGILKRLNVTEIIAQTEAEYIKIAVKLGLEPEWRRAVSQKIQQNQSIIYNDFTVIQSLEAFYESNYSDS